MNQAVIAAEKSPSVHAGPAYPWKLDFSYYFALLSNISVMEKVGEIFFQKVKHDIWPMHNFSGLLRYVFVFFKS